MPKMDEAALRVAYRRLRHKYYRLRRTSTGLCYDCSKPAERGRFCLQHHARRAEVWQAWKVAHKKSPKLTRTWRGHGRRPTWLLSRRAAFDGVRTVIELPSMGGPRNIATIAWLDIGITPEEDGLSMVETTSVRELPEEHIVEGDDYREDSTRSGAAGDFWVIWNQRF